MARAANPWEGYVSWKKEEEGGLALQHPLSRGRKAGSGMGGRGGIIYELNNVFYIQEAPK